MPWYAEDGALPSLQVPDEALQTNVNDAARSRYPAQKFLSAELQIGLVQIQKA